METLTKTSQNGIASKKSAVVPIEQIKVDIYARVKLNEDRVLYFAVLFEENAEGIPAIEVTTDFSVIDGRHRLEGAILAGRKEMKCIIKDVSGKTEQLEKALLSNLGGPLPPSKSDVVLVIKEMILLKSPKVKVMEVISKVYPASFSKKIYDEARHAIYRDNMRDAKRDVTDNGLSVPQAAEKYGIDIDTLRAEFGAKKKKTKLSSGEFKKHLSTQFRSQGQKISNIIQKAVETYDDGDMSKDQMAEVFEYFSTYVSRQQRRIKEEMERFNNRNNKK